MLKREENITKLGATYEQCMKVGVVLTPPLPPYNE